ncbi:C6 finger domain protein [Aspergillus sclerotialis]|uniref:C6 finger domain protein n=1 Tax=Aspergillus sclerotialis TaxID=2070753 RepID=A0A3A2ZK85_9EURO|nr:C6 finger domain protein [Aspergillus sclerotialis]
MTRSFTGCKRCKTRRQKCDEQRPVCRRCQAAGAKCQYITNLYWGGRGFSRSSFGDCMGSGNIKKLEYSRGEFVYTTTEVSSAPARLTRTVDPFSSLSARQRTLLHHFINDASRMTACHLRMQDNLCKMLIPMALQSPALLCAIAALSAVHLQALGTSQFQSYFREEIASGAHGYNFNALLATARTLCLAEIHAGAKYPNSWRAHVEGAKALITSLKRGTSPPSTPLADKFQWYLNRWYWGIVSLTALTGNQPSITTSDKGAIDRVSFQGSHAPDYLDEYWGFTVELSAIFCRIGSLAHEACTEAESAAVDFSIRRLMDHAKDSPPVFYPGVVEDLSVEYIYNFKLCNEAFQHSALIQLHRRLRKTPTHSPEIQRSVQRILECATLIGPSAGLSPWVMLNAPLFIAGCEAHGKERDLARQLLSALYSTIRVPNVLLSLEFLEQYWAQARIGEDWNQFAGRMQLDFIPY